MYIKLYTFRLYPAAILLISLIGSIASPVVGAQAPEPFEQDFMVTAYYSPLPDQCCYIKGSYEEDTVLNGRGVSGADGTPVYPGMFAAPGAYTFGTRIDLHGIGVGTVHDRGGSIIEWDNGIHRLDVWMGHGEEGLARSLAWGVQYVKGTVYAPRSDQPDESLVLGNFPAPRSALAAAVQVEKTLLTALSQFGDKTHSVQLLQQSLADLGYFDHAITGMFGDVTREALATFQKDYGVDGDGSVADDATRAAIIAARMLPEDVLPYLSILSPEMRGKDVRQAQKVMRYIGAYTGRTDGYFSDYMKKKVLAFQLQYGVITSEHDSGAGYIGPATRTAILGAWKRVEMKRFGKNIMRKMVVVRSVEESIPDRTLTAGASGQDVRILQGMLADIGFFPAGEINGHFGPLTEAAIRQYQLSQSIVDTGDAFGAGVFGPVTRSRLKDDAVRISLQKIREKGVDL